jgi:hypothetical protein
MRLVKKRTQSEYDTIDKVANLWYFIQLQFFTQDPYFTIEFLATNCNLEEDHVKAV